MEKQGYRELVEQLQASFPGRSMITVKEASKSFGVSERCLRDAMKRQEDPLPSHRIGGRVLIPVASLARWMA